MCAIRLQVNADARRLTRGAVLSTGASAKLLGPMSPIDLRDATEQRRRSASDTLDGAHRSKMGQFFTPDPVAGLMAGLVVDVPGRDIIRVLDPGAGVGSLSAALVAELCSDPADRRPIELVAYELDASLHAELRATLEHCARYAASTGRTLRWELRGDDYVLGVAEQFSGFLGADDPEYFDAIITNPPYRKINVSSRERAALSRIGLEVSNLYAAFLGLSVAQLAAGGVLVAISPRSFANGPYFESFRRFVFDRVGIDYLHAFDSRGDLFADTSVLQENIIFRARRDTESRSVEIAVSMAGGVVERRTVPSAEIIRPDDPRRFLRIPSDRDDTEIAESIAGMPCSLAQLGIGVSTGRVVDFRSREHLRDNPDDETVPLIYPQHLRGGQLRWPIEAFKKANCLRLSEATRKLVLPNETYVLVKRFTSKEERKRVSATVIGPTDLPGHEAVAVENHLNVYHCGNRGLDEGLAAGLSAYLNSSLVDRYVRQFNGHTQINATDLRHLRYPTCDQLRALGAELSQRAPDQEEIDTLVGRVVAGMRAPLESAA